MLNRVLAALMDEFDAPKCVYHSSSNGNNYCMRDNTNKLEIVVVDHVGEVSEVFSPTDEFFGDMMEKTNRFFKYISAHINTGEWNV